MLNRFFAAVSILLVLLAPLSAVAAVDVKTFSSEAERQRFQTLVEELRCPKCQNQNLADSNSPIAADLRDEIFRMLEEGKTDREIVDFLVARYGEFVLYKPPVKETTLVLWLTPALLLLVGLLTVFMVRRRQQPGLVEDKHLVGEEQARLKSLLEGENTPVKKADQGSES
ncbi:MAG: cytochrome c-type biogenesis protein CcmH [Gammaproteobacteria bacterium]|nr:MAG: cytochrome c-type biogenesis protein CcmH [Gammaproteobacteria bacterium]